jgi:hypothetical protein
MQNASEEVAAKSEGEGANRTRRRRRVQRPGGIVEISILGYETVLSDLTQ